jgi:hypothetical protein
MSDNPLQSLYRRFRSTLQMQESSFIVYASTDDGKFDAYPLSTMTDAFATHLSELYARFAVKISGLNIHAAIEMA